MFAAANVETHKPHIRLKNNKQKTPYTKCWGLSLIWMISCQKHISRRKNMPGKKLFITWREWAEDWPWLSVPGCCECGGSPLKWGWRCSPQGASCQPGWHPRYYHWWRAQDPTWKAEWEVLQSLRNNRSEQNLLNFKCLTHIKYIDNNIIIIFERATSIKHLLHVKIHHTRVHWEGTHANTQVKYLKFVHWLF